MTIENAIRIQDGLSPAFQKMEAVARSATVAISQFENIINKASSAGVSAALAFDNMSDRIANTENALGGASSGLSGFNSHMNNTPFGTFIGGLQSISSTLAKLFAVNKIADWTMGLLRASDAFLGINARFNILTQDQARTANLNELIYESAMRARGSYDVMADAVSKIAMTAQSVFPKPEDAVPFVENIQKLFTIGGSSREGQKYAMLQLQQSLGSGRLQGDELRSISENAPLIEKYIADYLGVDIGQIKQMGAKGEVTSSIVRNAIMQATDDINAKFETIPYTWNNVWTLATNRGKKAFWDIYKELTQFANSPVIANIANNIVFGFEVAARVIGGVINNIVWLTNTVNDFYTSHTTLFSALGSGLMFLTGVWAVYRGGIVAATIATAIWGMITNGFATASTLIGFLTTSISMFSEFGVVATFSAMSAAEAWAMILLPIALIIGAVFLVTAAVNYFAGTSYSALGFIAGSIMVVFTAFRNLFAYIFNTGAAVAEFLYNVWIDPLQATKNFFAETWNDIIKFIASAVNTIIDKISYIPGLHDLTHVSGGGLQIDYSPIAGGLDLRKYRFDYTSLGDAFDTGYNWGKNFKPFDFETNAGVPKAITSPLDDIADNTKGTKEQAEKIKEALDITDEDLKYLYDNATEQILNRFTTASIHIDMGGITNEINDANADIDGVITSMADLLENHVRASAASLSE